MKFKTPHPSYDVERELPFLKNLSRQTTRLHPRPVETLPVDASRFGGPFQWPSRKPKPKCKEHNCFLIPVLQIRYSDVPSMIWPPERDFFQLLWCPNDHAEYGYTPYIEIFWWSRDQDDLNSEIAAEFSTFEDFLVPRLCSTNPEMVTEYPGIWTLSEKQIKEINQHFKEGVYSQGAYYYQCCLSVAPGCKVGGFPHWTQYDETPTNSQGNLLTYLLTLESWECDRISQERWLPFPDRCPWGSASSESQSRFQEPTRLMLGDAGEINVFVDTTQDGWPIKWVLQSS